MIANEKVREYLKCVLTETELRENGITLARANTKVAELEANKKAFNDQIKADISAAESEIGRLSSMLQNGYEFRQVECAVERDYSNQIATVYRLDTGETVKTWQMSPDELQGHLFEKETA